MYVISGVSGHSIPWLHANPKYDTSVDDISYGTSMIHMFSMGGGHAEPQVGPSQIEDLQLIPGTESERREVFLRDIGNEYPLMVLILRCVHNDPRRRTYASEVVGSGANSGDDVAMSYLVFQPTGNAVTH